MERDRDTIGTAIGRIPSGCSILAVASGEKRTGMLVSWVQQASFDPLCVSVCVKRGRPVAPMIEEAGRFVLNLVGDDPKPMFRHFGKGFSPEEDAFVGLRVAESEFGPFLPDCPAQLGCTVLARIQVGDHDLYAAEVLAAAISSPAEIYVHMRKTGLTY